MVFKEELKLKKSHKQLNKHNKELKMLFLLLVALASADYIVVKEGFYASVIPTDLCISDGTYSVQYKKVDSSKVKLCAYLTKDCSGAEECAELPLGPGLTIVDKVPANIAYTKTGNNDKCEDHKDMATAEIFFGDCTEIIANTAYTKLTTDKKTMTATSYSDKECKTEIANTTKISVECDKCFKTSEFPIKHSNTKAAVDSYSKLYCEQYNGSALTAILMVVFALFFLF